jgi:hypothetical protein
MLITIQASNKYSLPNNSKQMNNFEVFARAEKRPIKSSRFSYTLSVSGKELHGTTACIMLSLHRQGRVHIT